MTLASFFILFLCKITALDHLSPLNMQVIIYKFFEDSSATPIQWRRVCDPYCSMEPDDVGRENAGVCVEVRALWTVLPDEN